MCLCGVTDVDSEGAFCASVIMDDPRLPAIQALIEPLMSAKLILAYGRGATMLARRVRIYLVDRVVLNRESREGTTEEMMVLLRASRRAPMTSSASVFRVAVLSKLFVAMMPTVISAKKIAMASATSMKVNPFVPMIRRRLRASTLAEPWIWQKILRRLL